MLLILVTNDLYDIAWRLRAISDDYRVYYNTVKNRYEVHSFRKKKLEFIIPYDELDARAVEYAQYTRVENAERIFAEIEKHNAKLEAHAT